VPPIAPKPTIIIAQVAGSGTGCATAMSSTSNAGRVDSSRSPKIASASETKVTRRLVAASVWFPFAGGIWPPVNACSTEPSWFSRLSVL
jgi:hypothetical protein